MMSKSWREMLEEVGGYENELVGIPAGPVREMIDEIERLSAKVEIDKITMDNFLGQIKTLSAENERYKKWFKEYGTMLATHNIGGYSFTDQASTQQKPTDD